MCSVTPLGLIFLRVNPVPLQQLKAPARPSAAVPGSPSHLLSPSPHSSHLVVLTLSQDLLSLPHGLWSVSECPLTRVPWPTTFTPFRTPHPFLLLSLLYCSNCWRRSRSLRSLSLIHCGGSSLRIHIIARKLLSPSPDKATSVLYYWHGPIGWFLYFWFLSRYVGSFEGGVSFLSSASWQTKRSIHVIQWGTTSSLQQGKFWGWYMWASDVHILRYFDNFQIIALQGLHFQNWCVHLKFSLRCGTMYECNFVIHK